jgi:hypothetical protein
MVSQAVSQNSCLENLTLHQSNIHIVIKTQTSTSNISKMVIMHKVCTKHTIYIAKVYNFYVKLLSMLCKISEMNAMSL